MACFEGIVYLSGSSIRLDSSKKALSSEIDIKQLKSKETMDYVALGYFLP